MSECIRVNMTTKKIEAGKLPEKYRYLGGRALTSQICADEIDPTAYPLGDKNKLIIAPGLLSQDSTTHMDRVTIGGKSPLTRGIAASNGGGITAGRLAANGVRCIIVEGLPQQDDLCLLEIRDGAAELVDASALRTKGTYETTAILRQKYGEEAAVACIGPAGEMLMASACVANADRFGQAGRICGRGGLGAVMGSKRLKAIVVANRAKKQKQFADREVIHSLMQDIFGQDDDRLSKECLPIGYTATSPSLKMAVSAPLKPGTIEAFRSYCGIDDREMLMRLNDLVNDIGLDTLETAAALGVFMEAGLIPWGDGERACEMVEEVRQGTSMGHLLGQGSSLALEAFNLQEFSHIQFQRPNVRALLPNESAYLTNETNNNGFCVTALLQTEDEMAFMPHAATHDLSEDLHAVTNCLFDGVGMCLYKASDFLDKGEAWPKLTTLVNEALGWNLKTDDLVRISRNTIKAEQQFNRTAGYSGEINPLGGLRKQDIQPRHENWAPFFPVETDTYLRP